MTDYRALEHLLAELEDSARIRGARHIQARVTRVRELLAGNAPAEDLALATAELVQMAARMEFQSYMNDVDRGERVLAGARAGHEAVYGTPEEKVARYAAYQEAVDRAHREWPEITEWRELSDLVAEGCGCSGWTIRRHIKNPIKKP